jgi:hypothetical protein
MQISLRRNVFETNSSSSHSITINDNQFLMDNSLVPDENGNIILTGGQFGWQYEKFTDALTKANYVAVYASLYSKSDDAISTSNFNTLVKKIIKDQTGATDVIFDISDAFDAKNWSYIDHQSYEDKQLEYLFSASVLRNFIFNTKSILFTGNDNETAPANFYDDDDTVYTHKLTMEGSNEFYKLTSSEQKITEDMVYALWGVNQYSNNNLRRIYYTYDWKKNTEESFNQNKIFAITKQKYDNTKREYITEDSKDLKLEIVSL